MAARTLGDLVRKLGERVLPEIIPILERGLESEQADQRQGVCIGLSEIMASTSRDMILLFVESLVPTVRRALCDPLPEVRQAAARTFDSLHNTVGGRALDDILSPMLHQLVGALGSGSMFGFLQASVSLLQGTEHRCFFFFLVIYCVSCKKFASDLFPRGNGKDIGIFSHVF